MKFSKSFLSNPKIFWIITLMFLLLAAWAANFEIDKSVIVQGDVKPQGMPILLQNRFEGKVSEIHVSNGDEVSKNQKLLTFETEIDATELDELDASIKSNFIMIARLSSQLFRKTPFEIDRSVDLLGGGNTEVIIREQQQELDSELSALKNALLVIRSEENVKKAEIEVLTSSIKALENQVALAAKKHELTKKLFENGFEGEIALMETLSELLNAQKAIQESSTQLSLARDELVFLADKAKSAVADFERETIKQLNAKKEDLRLARIRKLGLEARMEEYVFVSPTNGVISNLQADNAGQVFRPGDTLAEIIPIDMPLVFYAKLPVQYVNEIILDASAKITPSTLDTRKQLPLMAEVIEIAPDATLEEDNPPYYRITLGFLKEQDNLAVLKSGVTGSASLLLGRRTVLNYYFEPLLATFYGALTDR